MNKYNTITNLLKATCESIRTKEGTSEKIKHQDIPSRIAAILTPSDGSIQTKTSNDLDVNGKTVTVPSGYYAEQYTKDVNVGALKAPSIEVNTQTGVITANSLVSTSGYIESTAKMPNTKELTTYGGGTWTPSSTNGYSLSAGTYLTNTLQLKPDSNLKKENIKNGVSIYGVSGSYKGEEVKGIWEVVSAGTTYGFTKTSDGYYTSNNKAIANSAAVCKINLQLFEYTTITFSCINNAESIYDYGMIGQPNVILDDSSTDTEYSNSSKILKHFRDQQSSSVQTYSISFDKGSYFLYIKYRKDSSQDKNADSFKFTISSGAIEGKTGIIPSRTVDFETTYLDPGNGIEFEPGVYLPDGYNIIANDSGGSSGDTITYDYQIIQSGYCVRETTSSIRINQKLNCDFDDIVSVALYAYDVPSALDDPDAVLFLWYEYGLNDIAPHGRLLTSKDYMQLSEGNVSIYGDPRDKEFTIDIEEITNEDGYLFDSSSGYRAEITYKVY